MKKKALIIVAIVCVVALVATIVILGRTSDKPEPTPSTTLGEELDNSQLDNAPTYPTAETYEDYSNEISRLVNTYPTDQTEEHPFYSCRLIVSCGDDDFLEGIGAAEVLRSPDGEYILQFTSAAQAQTAYETISKMDGIAYAEPDMLVSVDVTENNESGSCIAWGTSACGADKFAKALQLTDHKPVTVAVIDTGVSQHEFLKGRLLDGFDLVDLDEAPDDEHGHGTHVAGIVVDATPGLDVNILPIRVLDENGKGFTSMIGASIRTAAAYDADVLNMSLGLAPGILSQHSRYIDDVVRFATGKGIIVVVAAGNDYGKPAEEQCPAHISECITVSAISDSYVIADFSNIGDVVDFAAPGVNINSSVPGGYGKKSGTSMAAPYITALCAMLRAAELAKTSDEVQALLASCCLDLGDPGKDKSYGYGLPQIDKLIGLLDIPSTPSEPTTTEPENTQPQDTTPPQATEPQATQPPATQPPATEPPAPEQEKQPEDTIDGSIARGECGAEGNNVVWSLFPNGTLIISGNGEMMALYSAAEQPWAEYSSRIKRVEIKENVSSISKYAFSFCDQLSNVSIPKSVTIINSDAFSYCDSLVELFIPSGVEFISVYAFTACESLKKFTVDNGNPYYCSDAQGIIYDKKKSELVMVPKGVDGSVVVPDGVSVIGAEAFLSCGKLTTITLPDSVREIAVRAFKCCSNLKMINIPKNVNYISTLPFEYCHNLIKINVHPDNPYYSSDAQGILYDKNTTKLIEAPGGIVGNVKIPKGVQTIGAGAFKSCDNLTSVKIPETVTFIAMEAFQSCWNLSDVSIQDNVTYIGESAFYDCAIKEFRIPNKVTVINKYTFAGCNKLENVVIPSGVTCIGLGAFARCGLIEITIPKTVTEIQTWAFENCSLKKVTFKGDAPQFGSSVFDEVWNVNAYYPANNVTWKPAVLQDYGGKVIWVPTP